MLAINPYLTFNGNTEEAFGFYKSVFGGEFASVLRFKDTDEAAKLPAEDQEKIMHISLPIGTGNILMGTDTLQSLGHPKVAGDNFTLSIYAESEAEADELFEKLSDDGEVVMPMTKVFWGSYFGMLTDQFGIKWMLSFQYPSPA